MKVILLQFMSGCETKCTLLWYITNLSNSCQNVNRICTHQRWGWWASPHLDSQSICSVGFEFPTLGNS